MNKNKKILTSLLTIGTTIGIAGVTVSCGKEDEFAKSKVILVAVDGAQEKMYDAAIKRFNESESAKKHGFEIKKIKKGVFDALNFGASTVGATDGKQVPDIFYAPHDRVTDLVAGNAVLDLEKWDPQLIKEIETQIGATEDEKKSLEHFGQVQGQNGDKILRKFMSIRHNTEGIVLASNLDKKATIEDLKGKNLEELVKEGKALINIQNWWFGNGSFAGLKPELIKKVLYKGRESITSGWLKKDENHVEFMNSLKPLVKLMYPIWEAVFKMSDDEFSRTVWAQKGITKSDLKASLSSDGGQVNQAVWALMKDNKINYSLVGSWDVLNVQKTADAKSFVITPELQSGNPYLQAPGFWSYLVNIRNINAIPERKAAIREFLKCIFSEEAYFQYFKQDAKVPFVKSMQEKVRAKQDEDAASIRKNFEDLVKSLGWVKTVDGKEVADIETFLEEYKKSILPYDTLIKFMGEYPIWGKDNYDGKPQNPLDKSYIIPKTEFAKNLKAEPNIQFTEEALNKVRDSFGDGLPLKNALATILNVDLSKLSSDKPWLIKKEILRKVKQDEKDVSVLEQKDPNIQEKLLWEKLIDDGLFHMRKVQDLIFDNIDHDNGNKRSLYIDKLADLLKGEQPQEKVKEFIESSVKRAIDFAKAVSVSFPKENTDEYNQYKEKVKKAITLHLNDYLNDAKVRVEGSKLLGNSKMLKKDGEDSGKTKKEVINEYNEYDRSFAINKLFEVLTSSKSLEDGGLGVFKTQKGIINNFNPQYGDVWGAWNEQTMGNLEFLSGIKAENEEQFINAIETKLEQQFDKVIGKVKKSGTGVTLDWVQIQTGKKS